ncbi:MAG: NAD-dependent epimerase/dehydratase family protein [Steroidobacteraceae bacterium]
MRVFLVGANSYIGRSLAQLLLDNGHCVSALARSAQRARELSGRGIAPVAGQVHEVAAVTRALNEHDACVWLSFLSWRSERDAVLALLSALDGGGKTFVFTSGTAVLGSPSPAGDWCEDSFAEDDRFSPPAALVFRRDTEELVREFGRRNVRAMVVRPPMVWGRGGGRQVTWLFETAAKTGAVCYIGRGLNLYSHVHVMDLAELYRLALEGGSAGALYHAVAGEVCFRVMAEAVAHALGCPARSISLGQMSDILGRGTAEIAFGLNSRSRCPRSRAELGWAPKHLDLIEDIRHGSYRAAFGAGGGESLRIE